MMSDEDTLTSIFYPKRFLKVRLGNKPKYDMDDNLKIQHYRKEGEAGWGSAFSVTARFSSTCAASTR